MIKSVYIESSVISYLVARKSRDIVITARQAITETWWYDCKSKFDSYISTLVIQEIERGDKEAATKRLKVIEAIPLVAISLEADNLAKNLINKGVVPINSEDDALHISIAATSGIDFLLTWNFKHINNANTKAKITTIVESCGFVCPILCSPEELGVEI